MPFAYILRCADDTLYTGFSVNPQARLLKHNAGKGAKYVRGRRAPAKLVWISPELADTSTALVMENVIKKLTRNQKEALISGHKSFCYLQFHRIPK